MPIGGDASNALNYFQEGSVEGGCDTKIAELRNVLFKEKHASTSSHAAGCFRSCWQVMSIEKPRVSPFLYCHSDHSILVTGSQEAICSLLIPRSFLRFHLSKS